MSDERDESKICPSCGEFGRHVLRFRYHCQTDDCRVNRFFSMPPEELDQWECSR